VAVGPHWQPWWEATRPLPSLSGVPTFEDMATHEYQPSSAEVATNVLMDVANTMVRLFKEQFGRGPTASRAAWAGPDTLVVVLESTFTPAERNLLEMGEHERLRETRMFFQYATVREFCAAVEHITGRKVRAFVSGLDTEADGLAVETFLLHPEGYDGPSRIERADP
jgi:uncharacterized protein YbcI